MGPAGETSQSLQNHGYGSDGATVATGDTCPSATTPGVPTEAVRRVTWRGAGGPSRPTASTATSGDLSPSCPTLHVHFKRSREGSLKGGGHRPAGRRRRTGTESGSDTGGVRTFYARREKNRSSPFNPDESSSPNCVSRFWTLLPHDSGPVYPTPTPPRGPSRPRSGPRPSTTRRRGIGHAGATTVPTGATFRRSVGPSPPLVRPSDTGWIGESGTGYTVTPTPVEPVG